MISSVRGTVLSVGLDHAVVEVGGVGLAVHTIPATLATLRRGEQAQLAATLVVREDSLTLYGFADADARVLFGLLQTVSGVGPRLALSTLAVLEPDALCKALADGNITTLTQVPGIGRKGAERLIIELRDKVGALNPAVDVAAVAPASERSRSQVAEALAGLGFTVKQADQALDAVIADNGADLDTAALLRRTLATLGRKR